MASILWVLAAILYCCIGFVAVIVCEKVLQYFFVLDGEDEEPLFDDASVLHVLFAFVREHPYWTVIGCLFWFPILIGIVIMAVWETFRSWRASRRAMTLEEAEREYNRYVA